MTTKIALGAAVLSLLALAGCTGSQPANLTVTCEEFAGQPSIQRTVETAVGKTVTVSLCSNRTTGYAWEDRVEISDPDVVKLASRTYEAPAEASPPVVGAAGSEVFTFDAASAGTTTVALHYSQRWEGGEKNAWTYTLTVTVR